MSQNYPEYTVAEFSRAIKQTIEDAFGYVKITGEITGLKKHSSGHLYFNLKDQNALINAVCFRNYTKNINFEIGDGLKISAFGKISTFEGRSNYQINIEKMEIAGIGAILEMLEKRKKKLTEEGLFDQIHKKPIPFFPKIIGVITSETGAVIQDIIHRITDRSPLHLLLYPSAVQGEKAPKEVIAGIKYFNLLKNQKPEVIIIARGGGSFEDLMPFNDEELVREVFKSSIPIISAIGHETDFTLLDFVADLRAPTPTASAEFVTPVLNDLKLKIKNITNNLKNLKENSLINKHNLINNLSKNIINFDKIIENKSNQTNIFFDKIYFQLNNFLNLNFSNLKILENKIITPHKLFQNLDLTVTNHHNKILNYSQNIFNDKNLKLKKIQLNNHNLTNKIAIMSQKIKFDFDNLKNKIHLKMNNFNLTIQSNFNAIKSCDYQEMLKRGFCVIKNDENKLISSINNLPNKKIISIEMFDGEVKANINFAQKNNKIQNFQPSLPDLFNN